MHFEGDIENEVEIQKKVNQVIDQINLLLREGLNQREEIF